MAEEITVYGFETSNNMKVRIALKHKGIPFKFETIDPADRSEIERLSGQPLTPVMVHGERVLFDSAAILRYLDANFPETPRLFAGSRERIWEIEEWEGFARHELHAAMKLMLPLRLTGQEDAEVAAHAQALFDDATAKLEEGLADHEWLVGDEITAADITAAPVVYRTVKAGFAHLPEGRDNTRAWMERVMAFDV
jgi:glutathione S-transferase